MNHMSRGPLRLEVSHDFVKLPKAKDGEQVAFLLELRQKRTISDRDLQTVGNLIEDLFAEIENLREENRQLKLIRSVDCEE